MKRFAAIALSALVIALLIGVYAGQTPQDAANGQRASTIEPAAGQQPDSDAVEKSIQRIEQTMEEMEKQNNTLKPEKQDDKAGDQSSAGTRQAPGIENLNAPTEPTGDGVTEIIHAESMKGDNGAETEEAAEPVQKIKPAAGRVEDAEGKAKDKPGKAQPDAPDTNADATTTEDDAGQQ
jgi:hypothetical protein